MMKRQVLVIEDSPEDRKTVIDALNAVDCAVVTLDDCTQALATVEQWAAQFDAVIIEEAMQGGNGLRLLREAHSHRQNLPVVMVTRDGNWDGYARAVAAGAIDYLSAPINAQKLRSTLQQALTT